MTYRSRVLKTIAIEAFDARIATGAFSSVCRSIAEGSYYLVFTDASDIPREIITVTDSSTDWCASIVTDLLLQEDSNYILLESGDFLLLE